MKRDDFENRLRRIPRSEPPSAWRTEVLAAIRESGAEEAPGASPSRKGPAEARDVRILWQWLRGLLWPHPVAWGLLLLLWLPVGIAAWTVHHGRAGLSAAHDPGLTPTQARVFAAAHREVVGELLGDAPALAPEPALSDGPRSALPKRALPDSAAISSDLIFRSA